MSAYHSILAINSATGPCSTAVWLNGAVAAYLEDATPTRQSARLMPMIEEVLRHSGTGYSGLSAVACTVGPGSFTGIRVALAAVRGICLAARLPGLGFTTLETLAFAAARKPDAPERIMAVLTAGKGEWYAQPFVLRPQFAPLAEPEIIAPEAALHKGITAFTGNIAQAPAGGTLIPAIPRADALAMLAAQSSFAPREMKPFYIRLPDAIPSSGNIC